MVLLAVHQHKQFQDQMSDDDELVLLQPEYILLV
jgi:hypothetical protein